MTPRPLIAALRRRGFVLAAAGEALTVTPASKLRAVDRHAIRQRKAALLAWLTTPDPAGPCSVCGSAAYWQDATGGPWHCRRCAPPSALDACTTLTLPGGRPPPLRAVSAAELEQHHGAAITLPDGRRVALAAVLDHASPEDHPDLLAPAVLLTFAASLAADGLVEASPPAPPAAPAAPPPAPVCCVDCRHYRPNPRNAAGIGACDIEAPERRRQPPTSHHPGGRPSAEPALWPRVPRQCDQFEALTDAPS